MKRYHMRRQEKKIKSRRELLAVIRRQNYLTLAMSRGREPYLVSLNYGYDPRRNCFYFHCARVGKKVEYLAANPIVWGQIIEDRGYKAGQCDHYYRTVQFRGRVSFLKTHAAKVRALRLMIRHLEPRPKPHLKVLGQPKPIANTRIGRIDCGVMSGKRSIR